MRIRSGSEIERNTKKEPLFFQGLWVFTTKKTLFDDICMNVSVSKANLGEDITQLELVFRLFKINIFHPKSIIIF